MNYKCANCGQILIITENVYRCFSCLTTIVFSYKDGVKRPIMYMPVLLQEVADNYAQGDAIEPNTQKN